jgi:hypothetical protein
MKRKYAVFTGVFALLLVVGIQVVEQVDAPFLSVKANFDLFSVYLPAPSNVSLSLEITSPKENAVYTNGTINFCLNVTVPNIPNARPHDENQGVLYKGSWMQKSAWLPYPNGVPDSFPYFAEINATITGIQIGKHSLNVTAGAEGTYEKTPDQKRSDPMFYRFRLSTTTTVEFTMSTSPVHNNPIISFPSSQNATFQSSSFPLNFNIDYPVRVMSYSLDGQESVPISGNTTLTGLSNGQHNVTVYATDTFGNTDASDTLFFNVNAPEFPVVTLFVAAVFVAVSIVVCIVVIVFRRKQKQNNAELSFDSS